MKGRIEITLVWAAHLCIRGDRVLAYRIIIQRPQWEAGAVLHLNKLGRGARIFAISL